MNALRTNNFDLLRLLAALQVAFLHSAAHLDAPIDRSSTAVHLLEAFPGVPIFYVISGFLIAASWERNPRPAPYARNRVLRIYPALWACLAVGIATAALAGVSFWRWEAVPWLLAQVSIGQFYNPGFLRDYGVGVLNGSLWTIPVELQFYVALPLLFAIPRYRTPALLALAGVSWASQRAWNVLGGDAAEPLAMKLFGVSLVPYLWMFLIGVLAHRHFDRLRPLLVGRGGWWLALYVLLAPFEGVLGGVDPKDPGLLRMLALGVATLACAFTTPTASERLLRGQDISYGLYIYHMLAVNLLVERGFTGTWGALGTALGLAAGAAVVSWLAVERPALQRKRDPLRAYSGTPSSTR